MKLVRPAAAALIAAGLLAVPAMSAWASAVDVSTEPTSDYDKVSVLIASGDSSHLVDSVSAGPLAAAVFAPIVLTPAGTTIGAAATSYLSSRKPAVVYVVGGTSAVTDTQVTAIQAADPGATVYRVAGADRYGTALTIATTVDKVNDYYASQPTSASNTLGAVRH